MDARLATYLESLGADPRALDDWEIRTAQRDGVDVAIVLTRQAEIHILPLVERRALSRRNIREFVAPIIARYGFCTTRVPLTETDHRLRVALRFSYSWSDSTFSYWVMTEVPYERENTMQEGKEPCL